MRNDLRFLCDDCQRPIDDESTARFYGTDRDARGLLVTVDYARHAEGDPACRRCIERERPCAICGEAIEPDNDVLVVAGGEPWAGHLDVGEEVHVECASGRCNAQVMRAQLDECARALETAVRFVS